MGLGILARFNRSSSCPIQRICPVQILPLQIFVDLGKKLSGFVAVKSILFSQRFVLGITVLLPSNPINYRLSTLSNGFKLQNSRGRNSFPALLEKIPILGFICSHVLPYTFLISDTYSSYLALHLTISFYLQTVSLFSDMSTKKLLFRGKFNFQDDGLDHHSQSMCLRGNERFLSPTTWLWPPSHCLPTLRSVDLKNRS